MKGKKKKEGNEGNEGNEGKKGKKIGKAGDGIEKRTKGSLAFAGTVQGLSSKGKVSTNYPYNIRFVGSPCWGWR